MRKRKQSHSLNEQFPVSPPCSCKICQSYCQRPGWWSVEEAAQALQAGYANRMMLEISPEHDFGVLSPAFGGCEGRFALQEFAKNGCTFLSDGLCELHESALEPLECRFCHHTRVGRGPQCHAALEKDWHTPAGQTLVENWARSQHLWETYCKITGKDPASPPQH